MFFPLFDDCNSLILFTAEIAAFSSAIKVGNITIVFALSGNSCKFNFGVGFCFSVILKIVINKLFISGSKKNGDIISVTIMTAKFEEVKNPNNAVIASVIAHTAKIK